MKNAIRLILSLLICHSAGIIGSIFTIRSVKTWYLTINKPSFNPPNWIFGPVWLTLYTLMGISLYLVWNKGIDKKIAVVFGIHLLLNALWSISFFGLHSPLLGLINIIFLLTFIIWVILLFLPISKTAGYLLMPYLLWVSFATILNISFVILNK